MPNGATGGHGGLVLPEELMQRYRQSLREQLGLTTLPSLEFTSREYKQFRSEALPTHLSFYEKACKFAGKLFKTKVPEKRRVALQEHIDTAHLDITPEEVLALTYLAPLVVILLGVTIGVALLGSLVLGVFFMFIGAAMMFALTVIPEFIATNWRIRASNQMVLSIFYVVTYMRHTSNLERAIEFAGEHLSVPLALDFRKILYDVEVGKYETMKESLESYLITWKKYNNEFIESFHLVESSLYEADENRRVTLLDKALDTILEETYEKMLHFAQNLKGPTTILYMMGIILPLLGLVVLPLVASFLGNIRWWHIGLLYNIVLPFGVYLLGKKMLATRPTGYGDVDVTELNPELKKYKSYIIKLGKLEIAINPAVIALLVGFTFFVIGLLPVLIHAWNPGFDVDIGAPFGLSGIKFIDYRASADPTRGDIGPFGLGSSLLSLFFPLAAAFSFGLYFRLRSKNVIKIRDETRKLEDEFSTALFQLGNKLGDGLPAEVAFERVAIQMEETVSGQFFMIVVSNMRKLGLGVKDAIFHPKLGAIVQFPSPMIHGSMKVMIESVRKGPRTAAQALLNVSRYIKEIHRVSERLKDLLAEVISDMKSQIYFLTPAIAAIVIGITSMITFILGGLTRQINSLESAPGGFAQVAGIFGDPLPTYYFQIVVGLYVVEIIAVLTVLANSIENGTDKLLERYSLGQNLIRSTTTYVVTSFIVMLVFNLIAAQILQRALVGT